MTAFFAHAQRIFDVARAGDSTEPTDFVLLIGADGGMYFVMDSPRLPETAAVHDGARAAFHITRNSRGVVVRGQMDEHRCMLEQGAPAASASWITRDRPLYSMAAEPESSGVGKSARRMLAA